MIEQEAPENNYRIRNFRLAADVQPLLTLIREIFAADQPGQLISENALRVEFEWIGHDPENDRWIIEAEDGPNRFLGHAWTFSQTKRRSVFHIAVHPKFRRRGLASALLPLILDRARALASDQLVAIAESDDAAADAFLLKNQFAPAGQNRFMIAQAASSRPLPVWPDGFQLLSLTEFKDVALYVEALNACYSDMWGHAQNTVPTTVDSYTRIMEEYPDYFNPDGMFLLFDADGRVSGLCAARVQFDPEPGQTGKTIDSPAIIPAYRSLPLLSPLTLTVMRWLDGQAEGDIRLDTWGDSPSAEDVYTSLGFRLLPDGLETEYLRQTF